MILGVLTAWLLLFVIVAGVVLTVGCWLVVVDRVSAGLSLTPRLVSSLGGVFVEFLIRDVEY